METYKLTGWHKVERVRATLIPDTTEAKFLSALDKLHRRKALMNFEDLRVCIYEPGRGQNMPLSFYQQRKP